MVTLRLVRNPAPSMAVAVALLRDRAESDEERDLLAVAEWVTEAHHGDEHDRPGGGFGECRYCGEPWPCWHWLQVQAEILAWLVVGSTALAARIRDGMGRHE